MTKRPVRGIHVVLLAVLTASVVAICPSGTAYYDTATGRCVSCEVLCKQSREYVLLYDDCKEWWKKPSRNINASENGTLQSMIDDCEKEENTTEEDTDWQNDNNSETNWKLIAHVLIGVIVILVIILIATVVLMRKGRTFWEKRKNLKYWIS